MQIVKLEKALELSKILRLRFCWKSYPMLDRVNLDHRQKLLGSSYLCKESSHTKSYAPSTFPTFKKGCGGGGWVGVWWWVLKVDLSVKL